MGVIKGAGQAEAICDHCQRRAFIPADAGEHDYPYHWVRVQQVRWRAYDFCTWDHMFAYFRRNDPAREKRGFLRRALGQGVAR